MICFLLFYHILLLLPNLKPNPIMFTRLLSLEWKSFFRSASFGKNLAMKILLAFLAIYFLSSFFFLGVGLYPLLQETFPEQKPMQIINMFVVYWFLTELFVRFMFQSLPVINIKPLLINNIKKTKIIQFLLGKTIFSPFNFFIPLLVLPFGVWNIVVEDYSLVGVLCWWIAVFSLMFSANFLNFLLNKLFENNIKGLLPYVGIVLLLFGLEYFGVFSISHWVGSAMNFLLEQPYLTLLPMGFCYLTYKLIYNYLHKNFYLDNALKVKNNNTSTADFGWVKRFGDVAPFLQLDLKLILRNKRTKQIVWMFPLFLFYGLLFYPNPEFRDTDVFLVFVGIFLSGIFLSNFGQFIPAWDSAYYSMLMSQNIPMRLYIKSKAYLMYATILVAALVSIPYVYFGKQILFLNLALAIYNAGVNVPFVLFMGSYNKKRIDLDRSGTMNSQGMSATQWLTSIPIFVLPILIGIVGYWLLGQMITIIIFAVLGIIGLLFREYFFDKIANIYKSRKYITINGFKQQS